MKTKNERDPLAIERGTRLARLRKALNYSVKAVAERVGLCSASIYFMEQGQTNPSREMLFRFADLYQTTADWIERGDRSASANQEATRLMLENRALVAEVSRLRRDANTLARMRSLLADSQQLIANSLPQATECHHAVTQ